MSNPEDWFKIDGIPGINKGVKKQFEEQFEDKINNQLIFIEGQTGSGKSITTPWYILNLIKNCEIHFLQPRVNIVESIGNKLNDILDAFNGTKIDKTKAFFFNNPKTLDNLKINYAHGSEPKEEPIINKSTSKRQFEAEFKESHIKVMTLGYYKGRVKRLITDTTKEYVVIIDEAHEKNVDLEFILIQLKYLRQDYDIKIKIIIMSATLDKEDIENYKKLFELTNCGSIKIESDGIKYHIKEHFLKSPTPNYEETILSLIQTLYDKKKKYNKEDKFKVLVFLTGPGQINKMSTECEKLSLGRTRIRKFYRGVDKIKKEKKETEEEEARKQKKAEKAEEDKEARKKKAKAKKETEEEKKKKEEEEAEARKKKEAEEEARKQKEAEENKILKFFGNKENKQWIIFSTNIAETSYTFPQLDYVIDCGYSRQRIYIPHFDLNSLMVSQISNAERLQRRGRVGREKDGEIFHIYTYETQQKMDPFPIPNISRKNLTMYILECLKLNYKILPSIPSGILFFCEFLDSKICPKLVESLNAGIISLKNAGFFSDKKKYEILKKIINENNENKKDTYAHLRSINFLQDEENKGNKKFNSIVNYKIFQKISVNDDKVIKDDEVIKDLLKFLFLYFETKDSKIEDKGKYKDDIDFIIKSFIDSNLPKEKEKDMISTYKFFFKGTGTAQDFLKGLKELLDPLKKDISALNSNIDEVKNILKDILSENKAYYYNNNLLILSKIINSEDKYQEIIKIQLDLQSKCNLIDDTIYYFVELSLADFISIKHCFIEEVKEGQEKPIITEFKQKIKDQFKSKTNLLKDTIVTTDKSKSEKNNYKSQTMKDSFSKISKSEAEKKKLFASYIFEKENQSMGTNLKLYKSLLKRQ